MWSKIKNSIFFITTIILFNACNGSNKVEVGNKTSMHVNPVYNAGTVMKGETINASFVIENTGNYPLVIADVRASCSCTVVDKPEEPVLPGKKAVVEAQVNTENISSGNITKSLRIVANTEPSVTELIIKAKIKSK